MIGKKFTNNLKSTRPTSLFEDPWTWGVARNLAYASIRDDIENIIRQTNENSAETFINARDLIQNLRAKKINQYINAERVTQNVDLTDEIQLKQIFMNCDIYQTINYVTKEKIIKNIVSHIKSDLYSFFNNRYAIIQMHCSEKDIKYEIFNYAFNTFLELKNKIISIFNEYQKHVIQNYAINVRNSENSTYKRGNYTYVWQFPDSFVIKGGISASDMGTVGYLIFYLNNNNVKTNVDFDDIIIVLDLHTLKLQNQTKKKKIDSQVLLNSLKSKDLLFGYAGDKFKKTKNSYVKIQNLINETNRIKPGNKLFN